MFPDRLRSLRPLSLAESLYRLMWALGARGAAPAAAHQAIFDRIYRTNAWGNAESRSGPGSTRARGAEIRPALRELFARHSVATVLDAPCGDFNWIHEVTTALTRYTGAEIVEELVIEHRARHAGDRHEFLHADITRDPLPRADLILCRDALVHFSFRDIWSTIANFRRTGSRFLLATSFIELRSNEDIRTGEWRPLNLEAEPFRFPPPIDTIDDLPDGGIAPDKRLCLWELASLG